MKLSTKISLSMGTLALLVGLLALFLLVQMHKINNASMELANRQVPNLDAIGEVRSVVLLQRTLEIRHIYSSETAEKTRLEKQLAEERASASRQFERLDKGLYQPKVRAILTRLQAVRQDYFKVSGEVLDLSRRDRTQEAIVLLNDASQRAFDVYNQVLGELQKQVEANCTASGQAGQALYEDSRMTGIILAMAAVLIALVLTLLIVRNTVRQLGKDPGELNEIAHRVVDGDYAVDDGGKKQGVYAAIVEMVNALKTHIENAQRESENAKAQSLKAREAMEQAEAASQEARAKTETMLMAADKLEQLGAVVSSASTELSAQIEQSDRGAAESAQRLAEAATAMNEMNATVQEVARNAGNASSASAETRQRAEAGAQVVEQAVHSIEEVHQMSLALKDDMTQLNEHAMDISRIMSVISDIADQTNLLALNAAIEAARAGEAGRGFAVVADEVRKLAEKTMASTQDVGEAIKAIQESTAKSMTGVDKAVERIGQANELASQSGVALQKIVATVESTADQVNAIATASEEQSAASEEINQSIAQVNNMSNQTAEAMGEAARAVADLAAQAQGLTELIRDMKAV